MTYRNVGHLGKIIATLDVLSGGRAVCGLGLAWFKQEHTAYGWPFPSTSDRYALLEDALQVLPMLWGPGNPGVRGSRHLPAGHDLLSAAAAPVPIVVGGGGERRTLRLAAQYADAANVMGDLATVRRKQAVLREHCAAVGRDHVELTHLSTTLIGADDRQVTELVDHLRPRAAGSRSLRRSRQRRHDRRPHRSVPSSRRGGRPGGDDPPPDLTDPRRWSTPRRSSPPSADPAENAQTLARLPAAVSARKAASASSSVLKR
jgi:alkanesulfonate monooxygenase SsuD/methylene tetrahydromethanopterin reductase-like flavin-dependent oxidoreductase (luciferase family)